MNAKLIESEKNQNSELLYKNLYKGACVKIKNSHKTFQVIGINTANETCWVREWPFVLESNKTFALKISQITLQIFCSNHYSE